MTFTKRKIKGTWWQRFCCRWLGIHDMTYLKRSRYVTNHKVYYCKRCGWVEVRA